MATIGVMLTLAVLAGSLSVQTVLAAPDEKPAAPKAPAKPKAPLAPIPPLGNGADWEDLFQPFDQLDNLPEQLREQMKQLREQMKQFRQQFQQQGGGGLLQFDPLGGFGRPMTGNRQQRLGVQIRVPSSTLIEQLDLPAGQGLVIEEVAPNSAAAKAGIKPHDVLLELDGKPVSNNPAELLRQVAQIKANTPVDAVVLRKGRKETIKGLTLPEVKADTALAPRPLFGQLPGNWNFGGGFGGFGGFGQGTSTSIQRQNNDFTALHSYNDVKLTVKGTINEGKAVIQEVVVEKAGQKDTYTDVEKVPAEYRGKVKKLAEMSVTGKLVMPFGD